MKPLLLLLFVPVLTAQTGESIYQAQCSFCHGQRGEGGRGATLARPQLHHAPDDEALYRVIRRGIPGTGMPGTALADREIRLVVTHVRSLGRVQFAPPPGDLKRGEKTFYGKGGCSACHMISGRGGAYGPDLTAVGARRSPTYLKESIVDPSADITRGFAFLVAATRDGRVVSGVRVNEDSFSVQLRDPSGRVHSFFKTELRDLQKDLRKSTMPSYRDKLTARELDDLVAWLAGLQGSL